MKNTLDFLKKYTGKTYTAKEALALTSLNLAYKQIIDITPIEKLTGLTTLDFSGNQITDLRPLEKLTNLMNLHLAHNQIIDLKPLEKLTSLTWLNLIGNKFTVLDQAKLEQNLSKTSIYF